MRSLRGFIVACVFLGMHCRPLLGVNDLAADAIREIALSPDGKKVALLADMPDGPEMQVRGIGSDEMRFTMRQKDLSTHLAEANVVSVDWSATSEWLAVRITDGDSSRVVMIDVAKGLKSARPLTACGKVATLASWMPAGNHLVAVGEQGNALRPAEDEGLFIVDPTGASCRQLTKAMRVVAAPLVENGLVVTKVEAVRGDVVTHRLISVDIQSGAVTQILP